MKIKFNDDFLWGTAISGPQSEGAKDKPHDSIMDYWFKKCPEDFHNQVGPEIASNMYNDYVNDIEIMHNLKLNSYRTSIQWTRLIDDLYTAKVNEKAVKFYRDYFSRLKEKNIKLIVNLFHFDMPIELENIGGWSNKKTIDLFVKYAKVCFEMFGDLVDLWATFNEPVVPIEGCYLYEWYYPKIVDLKLGIQAAYNTILTHARVVNLFHDLFKDDNNKKICAILNLTPSYPKDNDPINIETAKLRDELFNKSFLNSMIKGTFSPYLVGFLKKESLLPNYNEEELKEISSSYIDFLGVNYYQPSRIQAPTSQWDENKKPMPEKWFENYVWKDRRINPYRGWEIHPQTIYNIAMDLKENYNNISWFISENGMGVENESRYVNKDGIIEDDYRIDFIKEHLYWLKKSIDEGANCFGYHLWTFIDCWSWANSYKNRYGIISLDLKTQKRTIKKSGYWFKHIIENNNEIEIDESLINF